MEFATETRVEISDCPKGCGEPVSVTMRPTPMFTEVDGELRQVWVPGKLVHLSGYVQCAKACKGCGKPGYMKHITSNQRTFLHTETHKKDCPA